MDEKIIEAIAEHGSRSEELSKPLDLANLGRDVIQELLIELL